MSEQLAQSWRVVRRRWKLLVFVPLLAVIVSVVVSSRTTTEYTATAKVVISPYNAVTSLLDPGSTPTSADPERDLNTEVSEITLTPMANMVIRSLHLSETPTDLLEEVNASLEGTTSIVDIAVKDSSAARAAVIANSFASNYVVYRLDTLRGTLQASAADDQRRYLALTPAEQAGPAGKQLQTDINTLDADSTGLSSDASVSQIATPPSSPSQPKPLIDALIALVVGALVAIDAANLLELLDRSVRDEEDAVAITGLASLGVIPRQRSRVTKLATATNAVDWHLRDGHLSEAFPLFTALQRAHSNGDGDAAAADGQELDADTLATAETSTVRPGEIPGTDWELEESYAALAVSLLAQRLGPQENVVMVTSATPQDGKTSVSIGLGAALAELGQRVIVVESDLRRPRFAEYLGLPPSSEGLSTILAGESTPPAGLVEVVAATRQATEERPRLTRRRAARSARAGRSFTVLPCGPIPTKPLALLRGPELLPLMRQLQASADVVLIDTPPLGALKDALVLAESVDQIVLVTRIGHTSRDQLARCAAAVEQLGSPVLGVVVVGGARGGALDYYFRPEFDVRISASAEPKLVAVHEPSAPADGEQAEDARPKPQAAPVVVAKSTRSRRRAGADSSA